MSDASDNFENDVMLLVFNATAWANVADNAASAPLTVWYLGLHTASPTDSGNQTSSEITYTSYARKSVARTSGGFTITGGQAALAANQDFVTGTGGSGTATHFSVGNASTSTGRLQVYGTVTPNIVTGNGITPRLTTSTTITLA